MADLPPRWGPEDVDPAQPSIARVDDYYLGGSHNVESDRVLAREVRSVLPDLYRRARDDRSALRRAVQFSVVSIEADLREPAEILNHPLLHAHLDVDRYRP
jgi:hypothetical protein